MSVEQSSAPSPLTKTHDADSGQGVYGALFAKINLSPAIGAAEGPANRPGPATPGRPPENPRRDPGPQR